MASSNTIRGQLLIFLSCCILQLHDAKNKNHTHLKIKPFGWPSGPWHFRMTEASNRNGEAGDGLCARHLGGLLDHLGAWLQAQIEVTGVLVFREPFPSVMPRTLYTIRSD